MPYTINDLLKSREITQVAEELKTLFGNAQEVLDDILKTAVDEEKPSLIKSLGQDMNLRLTRLIGDNLLKEADTPRNDVMIVKQNDGLLRWMGIHSNNYRDLENQIIARVAHENYVELLQKGKTAFPDLWLWHEPVAIGTVDVLGFSQDYGATFSSGVFHKQYEWVADMVKSSDFAWGMSHGMPRKHLKFDPNDSRVIVEYIDREVSLLPLNNAASPLTNFMVL